jgi:hypothetical protein
MGAILCCGTQKDSGLPCLASRAFFLYHILFTVTLQEKSLS